MYMSSWTPCPCCDDCVVNFVKAFYILNFLPVQSDVPCSVFGIVNAGRARMEIRNFTMLLLACTLLPDAGNLSNRAMSDGSRVVCMCRE